MFVACSTNVGEGLVNLIMCNDVPAEEQHIPSVQPRLSGVECSVVPWSMFVIGSALTYMQCFLR